MCDRLSLARGEQVLNQQERIAVRKTEFFILDDLNVQLVVSEELFPSFSLTTTIIFNSKNKTFLILSMVLASKKV